ncbi:MAG TPA: SDR family oxidoreductase [Candidatus Limnocylindria bacterium]|nr:SDR family oxidoreductase [Candidatus Limnocylindria bacterium]
MALVTGSSRGIGRAVALRLAASGADIVVNYRVREAEARATADAIKAAGSNAYLVQANMADPADIERLFVSVADGPGMLDFLVCNAAAGIQGTMVEATVKSWDLAMNVNARSYLLCAQAAFPFLKARGGGRILAITAKIATDRAFPFYGTVAASKAAINTLTAYLAVEFGPHRISVNAISPGLVDTEALAYFRLGSTLLERAREVTPTGRPTGVEDIAALAEFLCSEAAGQVNGQIIEIDGGYTKLFL